MLSMGTLDIGLQNLLIFKEGLYKALLTVSSQQPGGQQERLQCEVDGRVFTEAAEGKILTEEWDLPGGKENIVTCDETGRLTIHLTKKSIGHPVSLHATFLKLNEDKVVHLVSDGFTVESHGKLLLYPKKKLFDQNKTIVHSRHTSKLKLISLLDNEMVQAVCGWLEVSVEVNIKQVTDEQKDITAEKQQTRASEELELENLEFVSRPIDDFKAQKDVYWPSDRVFRTETILEESISDCSRENKENSLPQYFPITPARGNAVIADHECRSLNTDINGIPVRSLKEEHDNLSTLTRLHKTSTAWKEPAAIHTADENAQPKYYEFQQGTVGCDDTNAEPVKEFPTINCGTADTGFLENKKFFHLPNINALRDILPTYHALSSQQKEQQRKSSVQPHVPINEPDQSEFEIRKDPTNDGTTSKVISGNDVLIYQAKELEQSQLVIQHMGNDICVLRARVQKLELEKEQYFYLASEIDIDGKDEDSALAKLRNKLVLETGAKLSLQERVNDLQNELIKTNDVEESFLKLQTAHQEQQTTLHDLQEKLVKLKRLEKLAKDQEKVIEAMEKNFFGAHPKTRKSPAKPKQVTVVEQSKEAKVKEAICSATEQFRLIQELAKANNELRVLKEKNSKGLSFSSYNYGNYNNNFRANVSWRQSLPNVSYDQPGTLATTRWRSGSGGEDAAMSRRDYSKYSYHLAGAPRREYPYPY